MRSASSTLLRAVIGVGAVSLVATVLTAPAASAAPADPSRFSATALQPYSTVEAPKSESGRRAVSDKALLERTDSQSVHVMVKLDYDATASYQGGLRGLPATSPAVTGKRLSGRTSAEVAYNRYTAGLDREFRALLAERLPAAKAGVSVRQVYGGVAVTLPANQAKQLLAIDGVAAVQSDKLAKPAETTIEGPQFIGAPTIWSQTGGQSLAGRGVIFADLDTGIWPEHPMLADNPALGTPPAAPSGQPRACDFGDNPLTPAVDVFQCNHKVIGGAPFLQTYNAVVGGEVYQTARDSNGHGTHTTTTAAGNAVTSAPIFGVERGPISGVAPGAWVLEYKVCGLEGCFGSDSAAAVQQAILDGANVINFSISGGSSPFTDPVELAFLDAYNAGVLVSASAGNSGPGAGTTDHRSPWVMTVAASTQTREFRSTLTVNDGAASATFVGTSLTDGVSAATPIVLAQDVAGYNDQLCQTPMAAGSVAGKIVACRRGVVGRVQKGFNVLQGGAVGMILYNLPLADVESDNHFLPTVHLADGTQFLAFMAAHPGATGSFTAGEKANGQGDVMAAFSSRGPGGQFLKPDITAPGVQVLAGHTPTPDEVAGGPAGQFYQAIAGTSMSAPHIAGSAILMKALHPSWTPGAIKSALMTTSKTSVVKEDLTTPADPFDMGAGRVDLTKAGSAPIVFDETADNMVALGANPLTAINLNTPSVNVPTMPGTVVVTRKATNLSGRDFEYRVTTSAPAGSRIRVSPNEGTIRAGRTQTFRITISSDAPSGQYFGQINITSRSAALHLPVAFFNKQGDVSLTQACDPTSIREGASTTCTVKIQNETATGDAVVTAKSSVSDGLRITGATGAQVQRGGKGATAGPVTLPAPKDAIPAIASGSSPAGYLPLQLFGVPATSVGDETALNFNVPGFLFGGKTYTRIGVVSNGYLVIGGATGQSDIVFAPQHFPNATRPNGVLAPYWTDLDGTGDAGVRVGSLTDGTNTWVVVQWEEHIFGLPAAARKMQVWIGVGGAEDISYAYDPATTIGAPAPADPGLTIGVENVSGTAGAQVSDAAPTGDYRVTTTPGEPGGSLTYTLTIRGEDRGLRTLTSVMNSDVVAGETRVLTPITVTR